VLLCNSDHPQVFDGFCCFLLRCLRGPLGSLRPVALLRVEGVRGTGVGVGVGGSDHPWTLGVVEAPEERDDVGSDAHGPHRRGAVHPDGIRGGPGGV